MSYMASGVAHEIHSKLEQILDADISKIEEFEFKEKTYFHFHIISKISPIFIFHLKIYQKYEYCVNGEFLVENPCPPNDLFKYSIMHTLYTPSLHNSQKRYYEQKEDIATFIDLIEETFRRLSIEVDKFVKVEIKNE